MNLRSTYYTFLLLFCLCGVNTSAQQKQPAAGNTLFTVGLANAFIGGLYDAYYPYRKLKQHGNFGLGAPDKLDGEVLMLNGHIYQTRSTGQTVEVNEQQLTPFAVVNFFYADSTIIPPKLQSKTALYAYIDSLLANPNGIYAIHIKGMFSVVKTRAFPPVTQKPYVPLAQMLALQHFFEFSNIQGDMVGYRIPAYMDGPNIVGYHFHFLSEDKQGGGHIIDFTTRTVVIEIEELNSFMVDIPPTKDFSRYDFKTDRREEVKRVETGSKN